MKYYPSVSNPLLILNALPPKERKKETAVGDATSVYVCEWGEALWWSAGNISNVELSRLVPYLDAMTSLIRSAAFPTVTILSALSCSTWMSNLSSRAIMISTVSRESAPRSVNLESGVMEFLSQASCSAMMSWMIENASSSDCAMREAGGTMRRAQGRTRYETICKDRRPKR